MSPLKSAAAALSLALLAGCGGGDAVGTGAGSIHVVVSPATTPFDQDGFAVRLDNGSPRTIPAAGDIVIEGVDAGAHTLQLTDVDLPCQVTGENPRTVTVTAGESVNANFNVECASTGFINVTTHTTGQDIDPDGYALAVDGRDAPLIGANAVSTLLVDAGTHAVTISEVAANCAVQGEDTQTVTVEPDGSADVTFEVVCTAVP